MTFFKCISSVTSLACTCWYMIYNSAFCINSTCVNARIHAFVLYTSLGFAAIRVQKTLRSTAQIRVSEKIIRTGADADSILNLVVGSWSTGTWFTWIRDRSWWLHICEGLEGLLLDVQCNLCLLQLRWVKSANNTKNYKMSAIKKENLILELSHANNFLN